MRTSLRNKYSYARLFKNKITALLHTLSYCMLDSLSFEFSCHKIKWRDD